VKSKLRSAIALRLLRRSARFSVAGYLQLDR
jgi:hypothetical protein